MRLSLWMLPDGSLAAFSLDYANSAKTERYILESSWSAATESRNPVQCRSEDFEVEQVERTWPQDGYTMICEHGFMTDNPEALRANLDGLLETFDRNRDEATRSDLAALPESVAKMLSFSADPGSFVARGRPAHRSLPSLRVFVGQQPPSKYDLLHW